MVFNGILGGIGGAYLVLVQLGVFTENMISGRGYIALATVILGRYTPFWNVWSSSFVRSSQCPADSSPDHRRIHFPVPSGNFAYALTLIAMLGLPERTVNQKLLLSRM